MHSKDSEPQTFFGYTGHFDLMNSEYKTSPFFQAGK